MKGTLHFRALVHMDSHFFSFRVLEDVEFALDLHQLTFYPRKRWLWKIGRAGFFLAADRRVFFIWRGLNPFLHGLWLEPLTFLKVLLLHLPLLVLLILRGLRFYAPLTAFYNKQRGVLSSAGDRNQT